MSHACSPRQRRLLDCHGTVAEIAAVLRAVKIDDVVVYAFLKCGFLVTDYNADRFTDRQIAEWDAACLEYEIREAAHV